MFHEFDFAINKPCSGCIRYQMGDGDKVGTSYLEENEN